jgi:hypothetical protein
VGTTIVEEEFNPEDGGSMLLRKDGIHVPKVQGIIMQKNSCMDSNESTNWMQQLITGLLFVI